MTKSKLIALGLSLVGILAGVAAQQGLITLPAGTCPPPPPCVCGK